MELFGLQIQRKKDKSKDILEELQKQQVKKIRYNETKRINDQIKDMERQIIIAEKELELQQLQERLDDFYPVEEEAAPQGLNIESQLMQLVAPMLSSIKSNPNTPSLDTPPIAQAEPELDLSDDAIKAIIKEYVPKKFVKVAKKLPDNDLRVLIVKQSPYNLTEEQLNRVIKIMKEEF